MAINDNSIAKYLDNVPSKDELVDLLFNIRSLLSKAVFLQEYTQNISNCTHEDIGTELNILSKKMLHRYFRNVDYPRYLFTFNDNLGSTYHDEAITPNFITSPTIDIEAFNNEMEVNIDFIEHFESSLGQLPSVAELNKFRKSRLYETYLQKIEKTAKSYVYYKYHFLEVAESNNEKLNIFRLDDYIFCAELVFFQAFIKAFYCYRVELERAVEFSGKAITYTNNRKKYLEKAIHEISGIKRLFDAGSRFDIPYPIEAIEGIKKYEVVIKHELMWYERMGLFNRLKDTYLESAFTFKMIDSLLEHGLEDKQIAFIANGLTGILYKDINYGSTIYKKISKFRAWKEKYIIDFGFDAYEELQLKLYEESPQRHIEAEEYLNSISGLTSDEFFKMFCSGNIKSTFS